MKPLYTLSIWCYGFAISIACVFNKKAKKWKRGRKGIFESMEKVFATVKEPLVWFHCSSLGEFEQGRPVIEILKQQKPNYKILLTFFSPSGYEVRHNYSGADFIFYLPLDTPANAKKFIQITKPAFAVFIKYEFWYNHLQCLHNAAIPAYIISAKFRAEQYFFKGYASWFRKQLKNYRKFFVQDVLSENLLKSIGIENVLVTGDTRLDRVITIAEHARPDALVKAFKGDAKLWLCGSTWPDDEKRIAETFYAIKQSGLKLLLVPHEVSENHIKNLMRVFPQLITYSSAGENKVSDAKVLVIDKMGLLSSLYQYGDMAYIGGGFGKGIHNLAEAAVFGIPVLFGPNYHKFNEAFELIKRHGGFSVATSQEMLNYVSRFLQDDTYRKQCGTAAKNYIHEAKGATEKITKELLQITA